jgi:hypothetical protein
MVWFLVAIAAIFWFLAVLTPYNSKLGILLVVLGLIVAVACFAITPP